VIVRRSLEAASPSGSCGASSSRSASTADRHKPRSPGGSKKEQRRTQPLFYPFGPEGLFEHHGATEAFVDPASGLGGGVVATHLPPKRMRRDERFYAEMAAAYAEAVSAGNNRPVDTIAEALGRSRNTVKDVIREARARGLLTQTTHGRAGGRLTAKARKLLKQRQAASSARRPP
jgi:biotin operon repressor